MASPSSVLVPQDYDPENDKGDFMNSVMLEYFRQKLSSWKEELFDNSRETLDHLKEENWNEPDPNDRATTETDTGIELRTREIWFVQS